MNQVARYACGLALALVIVPSACEETAAQTSVASWKPTGWYEVDSIPDVDGDGFRDLVIGNQRWEPNPGMVPHSVGRVFAYSGRQRKELWALTGSRANQHFGRYLQTIGDMNGDGITDVGFTGDLHSYFVSGSDGSLLYRTPTGWTCIDAIGDVNGDGLADALLAGSWILLGGLWEFRPGGVGNVNCAAAGDVNGDGVPDFLVGYAKSGVGGKGQAVVYSGADASILHHILGPNRNSEFGETVCGPGDFTGDGFDDFCVGEPEALLPNGTYDGMGSVYFYDGKTGDLVQKLRFPKATTYFFGRWMEPAGDVNGNGTRDLLIGSVFTTMSVIDGATRTKIFDLALDPFEPFHGDAEWTGDDFPDIFGFTTAAAELISGAPIGVSELGRVCVRPGVDAPRIGCTGSAKIGADFPVHLSQVEPGDRGILVLGALGPHSIGEPIRSAPWDCGPSVVPMQWMNARAEPVRPGEGAAHVTLPIPDDTALVGTAFHMQWLVLDGENRRGMKATSKVLRVELQGDEPPKRARSVDPGSLRRMR